MSEEPEHVDGLNHDLKKGNPDFMAARRRLRGNSDKAKKPSATRRSSDEAQVTHFVEPQNESEEQDPSGSKRYYPEAELVSTPQFPVEFRFNLAPEAAHNASIPCSVKFLADGVDLKNPALISIKLPSGLFFLPDGVVDLDIVYEGEAYAVTWVGGVFEFTEDNIHGISFLRKPKST